LNIPFFTLDLEKEYKKDVADYMINEYKLGRTPNPDVMCNKYVKFGGFFDWAMQQGADYVATGHYARVALVESKKLKGESKKLYKLDKLYELLTGVDTNKDQTYFLWTLTQKQLSKTLFPIGDIEKPEVRKIAKKLALSTAVKKDSQGVCFLGKFDMKEFLTHYIKEIPGKVLNEKGDEIGIHDGCLFLTIGQRHGFNITQKTPNDNRYYIISKDIERNTITVSQDLAKIIESESKIVKLKNTSWTLDKIPDLNKKYSARIRYRQKLEECIIVKSEKVKGESDEFELHFTNPQKAISSGQSAVIYYGEVCLGGGIIK
jgi:tRNA-specific 2-thiouridylase